MSNPRINFAEGSHWYDCRNGDPTPEHDADLRVARKRNLYISPTSIEKRQFVNEFLTKWKTEQVALAAAWNPIQPHEDEESYMNRIYKISLEKSITAADFGKEVHSAIEVYPQLPLDPKLVPFIQTFGEWHDKTVKTVECSEAILVDHDLGIAGRGDRVYIGFDGNLVMTDWKTQGVKVSDKGKPQPAFYDSWSRQLAFYSVTYAKKVGMFPKTPICESVVIDSRIAQPPFVKRWSSQEIKFAYMEFVLAAWTFFNRKQFFPQPNGMFEIQFGIPLPE